MRADIKSRNVSRKKKQTSKHARTDPQIHNPPPPPCQLNEKKKGSETCLTCDESRRTSPGRRAESCRAATAFPSWCASCPNPCVRTRRSWSCTWWVQHPVQQKRCRDVAVLPDPLKHRSTPPSPTRRYRFSNVDERVTL